MVERAKKLKSMECSYEVHPYEMTSFSGRPGMRSGSQGNVAVIRVKLGRQVASNDGETVESKTMGNAKDFRLGCLLRNLEKDPKLYKYLHSNECSLKVQPSTSFT